MLNEYIKQWRFILLGVVIYWLVLCCLAYAQGDKWLITAYCPCKICYGKNAKGITASGKRAKVGMAACNWLKFGTKVKIDGKVYVVEDRGAKSLFGDKNNHIKHIDIFFNTHNEAKQFGRQYLEVEILN